MTYDNLSIFDVRNLPVAAAAWLLEFCLVGFGSI
jgi:hypothetical protein